MIYSYLLIACQGLKKQPGFAAIKILSLTIGLACSILVLMHVYYATHYDSHFANAENIYRLGVTFSFDGNSNAMSMTSDAYAPSLRQDYAQIEEVVRIRQSGGLFSRDEDEPASSQIFLWAEPGVINLFSLEFISGEPTTALNEPNVVVLTETLAQKYFADEDPLGQTLSFNTKTELRVTGVIKDLPPSSLNIQMLISVATGRQLFPDDSFMGGNAWNSINGTFTYLSFANRVDAAAVSADLNNFITRNVPLEPGQELGDSNTQLVLEPLNQLYLSTRTNFGNGNNRSQMLLALSIFGGLILLTSAINFANLSLSQIHQRSKEIGVRKTLGAKPWQIVLQFIIESLVLTLIALIIALPLVYFAIPAYTSITNTGFTFNTTMQSSAVMMLLIFVLATGLVSGLFPALALSRFQTVNIIKGASVRGKISRTLRSGVTVVQFTLASALMILATAITLQINYLNTMDVGFNKNNLLYLSSRFNPDGTENFAYEALVNELGQHPGIVNIAKSSCQPSAVCNISSWRIAGGTDRESESIGFYDVGVNYLKTMELNLLAGRWFSADFSNDFLQAQESIPGPDPIANTAVHSVVITRDAMNNFGFATPEAALDKTLFSNNSTYNIIGVVENFRMNGGLEDMDRTVQLFRSTLRPMQILVLRIDPAQLPSTLEHINQVWERHKADTPIQLNFFDQNFNAKIYEQTNGLSKAAIFASIVTVVVSIFGLYGLAYYSSQRRTKEVGVRKVLGSTSKALIGLLTWDFIKPVLIACVLSWPIGYFAITQFFEQFSSRLSISPLVYLLISLGTIILAILTVSLQCIKAANSDPVESLRYE